MPSSDHFQGKSPLDHLKEARARGLFASAEVHGTGMSRPMAYLADGAKETAVLIALIGLLLHFSQWEITSIYRTLLFFTIGLLIWKGGRSALLGWARLERLHRLIEEERYEIEHNRAQEKEELLELYESKGFKGKMLIEVVEVLMSDDQKLLHVMLEEEFGLTLESYEHPLKQAAGSIVGVVIAALTCLSSLYFLGWTGLIGGSIFVALGATLFSAIIERNNILPALLWTTSVLFLTLGLIYVIGSS